MQYHITIRPMNKSRIYEGTHRGVPGKEEPPSIPFAIKQAFQAAGIVGRGTIYGGVHAEYHPSGDGRGIGTWHVWPAKGGALGSGPYVVHVSEVEEVD